MMSVLSKPDRRDGMSLPPTISTGRRSIDPNANCASPDARSRVGQALELEVPM